MMNIIQTFTTFSCGTRCPDREARLRRSGFYLFMTELYLPEGQKPKKYITEYVDDLARELGVSFHVVYIRRVDYIGYTYYDLWRKVL